MNFFSLYKRKFLYKIRNKINIDTDLKTSQNTLEDLFAYYGTDKANKFENYTKKGHGYSEFYQGHFEKIKNKDLKILEIGSYSGASAAAFSKYFPNSKIFCIDVNISNFKYSSKKIEVFGLDISDFKMIKNFFKEIGLNEKQPFFDIIIDDGSHKLSDILYAFKILFQNLRSGGFYIIEDYKLPNLFKHLNNIDDIKINAMLENLKKKKIFSSKIINQDFQKYLIKNINNIYTYKGKTENSDICFIKKND